MNLPFVTIITVNYNGGKYLKKCFSSLYKLNYPKNKLEIIMVDNGSEDKSVGYVKKYFPKVKIIKNDTNNYCRANNLGIKASKGEYVALINNDVKVDKNWLTTLVKTAQNDVSIGAVGSKILFMDGSIQSVGHQEYPNFYWGDIGFRDKDINQYDMVKGVISICGCSVLYRRKCLRDVGFLDEDFNMFMEDVDMSIRCRKKGWKLVTCPESIIYHKFHSTIGNENDAKQLQEINRLLLIAKYWPDKLADALFGKGHFTVQNHYGFSSERDINAALGKIFVKLIKEHGLEFTNKLSPVLFEAVHKIYNFEKDSMSQEINFLRQKYNIFQQENNTLQQKYNNDLLFLRQKKDHEIASLIQKFVLLRKEKNEEINKKNEEINTKDQGFFFQEQKITLLKQELESLQKQNEDEINQIKWLEQEKESLRSNLENKNYKLQKELQDILGSTGFRYLLKPLWDFLWSIKKAIQKINKLLKILYRFRELVKVRVKKNAYFSHIFNNTFPPYPHRMILMITKNCNLNCLFCDIPKREYVKKELSKEEIFRIIDSAAMLGITYLEITGGEPFLHPYLFDVIDYAVSKSLKVGIVTNGMLIKQNLERIKNAQIDSISISIDGFSDTHNTLRNNSIAFDSAIEAINVLKESSLPINLSVNFLVTQENVLELEKVYDYFTSKDIRVAFWPVNNQPHFYLRGKVEKEAFIKFVKKLKRRGKISKHLYRYYVEGLKYFEEKYMRVRCLGLIDSFGIDVEGDVMPCCVWDNKAHLKVGNALKDDLQTLWYSEKSLQIRKDIFYNGCNNCYNICLSNFSKITGKHFYINIAEDKQNLAVTDIKERRYINQQRQSSLVKPISVLWSATVRCNLSCLHCDNWKAKNITIEEVSTEQIQHVILELKEWLDDFEFIIGGGEPFLRKDIIPLIEFCSKQKVRTTITTNGTLLNKDICDELLRSGLTTLNFSLDGLSSSTHDFTRNSNGVLEKVLTAIHYLGDYRNDMAITISAIIMQTNLNEITALIDFVKSNRLTGIYFLPLMQNFNSFPDPAWYKKSRLWPHDTTKLESAIDKIIAMKKQKLTTDTGSSLIINSVHHLNLFKKYYRNPEAEFIEPCTVGRRMFSITEDGHILLCPLDKPVGSICQNKITQYFYSPNAELIRARIDSCKKSCKILGCYNAE